MNILEEFWYGNIEPAEYDISPSKECKELLQLITQSEDDAGCFGRRIVMIRWLLRIALMPAVIVIVVLKFAWRIYSTLF